MNVILKIQTLRKILRAYRQKGKTIGFVPTMGYLHDGHLSLIRKSKKENDITVVSIFVNPLQFGPREDFKRYPRNLKRDTALVKKAGADILFYPSTKEIYSSRHLTFINVKDLTSVLCGRSRPGHFQGVATVVCKLLNIVGPDALYLGQKDAQQVVVIKKMIEDLNIGVKVIATPIIREKDGLAMSSRNVYLNARERKEAVILYQSLLSAKQKIQKGERKAARIVQLISSMIRKHSAGKIDYIACVDALTLQPLKKIHGQVLVALAVYFWKTRLIDNILLNVK